MLYLKLQSPSFYSFLHLYLVEICRLSFEWNLWWNIPRRCYCFFLFAMIKATNNVDTFWNKYLQDNRVKRSNVLNFYLQQCFAVYSECGRWENWCELGVNSKRIYFNIKFGICKILLESEADGKIQSFPPRCGT